MAATPTSAPWLYGATLQHTHVFGFSSISTHGTSTGASSASLHGSFTRASSGCLQGSSMGASSVCPRWSSPEPSSTVVNATAASVSSGCMLSSLPFTGNSSVLVGVVAGTDGGGTVLLS